MNPEEIKAMKKGAEIIRTVAISIAIVFLCLAVGVSMSASGKGEDSSSSSDAASNAASFWWPIEAGEDGNPRTTHISSNYGYRTVYGKYGMHYGIDIARRKFT